ncbi:hypothetical protein D8S82_30295 [Mycobacterium hodleri]|uniref:Uncharacterized protein n=1 Tax=Mycolicibacterium hodleri TaxID=49897 RepID=A0A544VS39_9MYCO|nr:hypothetical protein [Mycolicibacterium hodleri]TQR82813.1 hypothetical protein D8S82_30295 [Mycolicibacterium hodleri]
MRITVDTTDHRTQVVPKFNTARVSIRAGPITLTVSPAEAVAIADQLVDAAERINNQNPTAATKETHDRPARR